MDFAREVKSQVDIVRVIGDYVRLKKAGVDRYVGLCPFHSEKTPSFSVQSRIQIFKCFGCGKGGDVFNFVMEHQGLSFREALELIAEQHGIAIPKGRDPEASDAEATKREIIFRAHEFTQQHFAEALLSPRGEEARTYLKGRGLDRDTVDQFGIGYAPPGNGLVDLLRGQGLAEDLLIESGLVGKPEERPGLYSFFRDRVTFPIHGHTGKVIGFGARALRDGQEPKYLNSRESPIYNKRTVLYNMHRAKESIRKNNRVVLVEGYMDVIGVAGAGIAETVACCGTSLTPQHAHALSRQADSVIINFDSDNAGQAATERSVEVLLQEGLEIRVLALATGKDPDDFCRDQGGEAYLALLEKAPSYFIWLADRTRKQFDLKTADGRMKALEALRPAVNLIPQEIKRAALAEELASHLGVNKGLILEEFRRSATQRRKAPLRTHIVTLGPSERLLLELFIDSPAAREEMLSDAEEIARAQSQPVAALFTALQAAASGQNELDFSAFEARLDEANRELLNRTVFERDRHAVSIEEGRDALVGLRQQAWENEYREVRQQIADAERSGDREKTLELLAKRMGLEKRLAAIRQS
jgi:DNA primase